jgi:hypothetical protein
MEWFKELYGAMIFNPQSYSSRTSETMYGCIRPTSQSADLEMHVRAAVSFHTRVSQDPMCVHTLAPSTHACNLYFVLTHSYSLSLSLSLLQHLCANTHLCNCLPILCCQSKGPAQQLLSCCVPSRNGKAKQRGEEESSYILDREKGSWQTQLKSGLTNIFR